ncbi:MAG: hypothetical protein WCL50_14820 [Spirochaetota bacterium]
MTLLQKLSENFSSTWKLLSETTYFLSRASILHLYENELKEMRHDLESHRNNRETITRIKNQIIEIRRALRMSGYDLSLADYNLVVDEFKNDAAMATHRRMVLFIGNGRLWIKTGEANHNTLFEYLSQEIKGDIEQVHYLWYRWNGKTLYLSGSDSEDKADYEKLKRWSAFPENKYLVLKYMKRVP